MHFWIDKRSQACGFNGRHRIPASLSSARRQRSKPMVTPVHRFQSIESGAVQLGRRPQMCGSRSRPANQVPPCLAPTISNGSANGIIIPRPPHSAELDSSVYLDAPVENGMDTTQQAQLARLAARKKLGMWASVILTVSSVALTKFYADRQGTGVMTLMLWALGVPSVGLLMSCILSSCRTKSAQQFMNSQTATQRTGGEEEISEAIPNRDAMIADSSPRTSVNVVQGPEPEQPPPPYHIAILLPPKKMNPEDVPPPSYDSAVR